MENAMKIVGAAFILDSKGRVLLVKHTYGRLNWELPGGRSEVGESPVETAVREVKEETGLAVIAQHTIVIQFILYLCVSVKTTKSFPLQTAMKLARVRSGLLRHSRDR